MPHVIGVELEGFEDGLSPEERAALEPEREAPAPEDMAAEREDLEAILEDGEQQARERPQFVGPLLPVEPVDDFDGRVAEIDARRAELRTQRRDGELDFDEAEEQLETLAQQRQELVLQQRDAVRAAQHNESVALSAWTDEVEAFARAHPEIAGNDVLWGALDATVRRLANQQDASGQLVNADKGPGWFLDEAHRLVSASTAPPAHRDRAPGREPEPEPEHATGDVSRDALSLEEQLARLRPDQVETYLREGVIR